MKEDAEDVHLAPREIATREVLQRAPPAELPRIHESLDLNSVPRQAEDAVEDESHSFIRLDPSSFPQLAHEPAEPAPYGYVMFWMSHGCMLPRSGARLSPQPGRPDVTERPSDVNCASR